MTRARSSTLLSLALPWSNRGPLGSRAKATWTSQFGGDDDSLHVRILDRHNHHPHHNHHHHHHRPASRLAFPPRHPEPRQPGRGQAVYKQSTRASVTSHDGLAKASSQTADGSWRELGVLEARIAVNQISHTQVAHVISCLEPRDGTFLLALYHETKTETRERE
jgi:hypothetical protein